MTMKKMLRKVLSMTVLCVLLVAMSAVISGAEEMSVMPRLTGIDLQSASLEINEYGRALCGCSVLAKPGYSIDVTMALEQDGSTIKTWTGSGSRVDLSKPYYVTSGHDYQVIVTTRVKTMEGSYLLSYTIESPVDSY